MYHINACTKSIPPRAHLNRHVCFHFSNNRLSLNTPLAHTRREMIVSLKCVRNVPRKHEVFLWLGVCTFLWLGMLWVHFSGNVLGSTGCPEDAPSEPLVRGYRRCTGRPFTGLSILLSHRRTWREDGAIPGRTTQEPGSERFGCSPSAGVGGLAPPFQGTRTNPPHPETQSS